MKKHDILDKPVHAILVKPNHLQQMADEGRLPEALAGARPPLPQSAKPPNNKLRLNVLHEAKKQRLNMPNAREIRKKQQLRLRISTVHSSIPPIDPALAPPCTTCKTSACCRAFIVNITEAEYESGLYGDVAIKIPQESLKQLRGRSISLTTMNGPNVFSDKDQFVFEGMLGRACPFLQENGDCGIYDRRPVTCRTYTCVNDDRITDEMRAGTEPILSGSERLYKQVSNK